jgi:two-component system, NarL family, response regulator NreC
MTTLKRKDADGAATPPAAAPTRTVTVYLVDDEALLRAAFRSWIEQEPGFEVVGEQRDARAAIAEVATLRPDVMLLDITLPGLSGIDALPELRRASPSTRILMLSHHEGGTFVQQALEHGADGYLSKDSEPDELFRGIRSTSAGRPYLSPKVAHALVAMHASSAGRMNAAGGVLDLTPREREVFLLLSVGKSNKQVARELRTTLGTAKKHRENLQRKLDCHSAAELARLAIREGLLGA